MKTFSATCPNCGRTNNSNGDNKNYKCEACGMDYTVIADQTVEHVHTRDAYKEGYLEELGRENARREILKNKSKPQPPTRTASNTKSNKSHVARIVITIIICVSIGQMVLSGIASGTITTLSDWGTTNPPASKTSTADTTSEYVSRGGSGKNTHITTSATNDPEYVCVLPIAEETRTNTKSSSVYLTDLKPYTGLTFTKVSLGDEDIFGNKFHTGLRCYKSESTDIWRLDKNYSTFVFTIGVHEFDKGASDDYTASICIYLDGELVYEKLDYTSTEETETISLDVSGATDLEIYMSGYQFFFAPTIFDPTLYR